VLLAYKDEELLVLESLLLLEGDVFDVIDDEENHFVGDGGEFRICCGEGEKHFEETSFFWGEVFRVGV
jgi:hypothetical protein